MRSHFVRLMAAILLICGFFPLSVTQAEGEPATGSGFFFDTLIQFTLYGGDGELAGDVLSLCEELEATLSKTVEGSDVWRINHSDGEPVSVSGHTLRILEEAIAVSDITKGGFDVTIAPVVALWNFTGGMEALPDPDEIAKALTLVDYRTIVIEGATVALPPGAEIDLGGIAKGYIADAIAGLAKARGVTSGMINLGGNVLVIGTKPDDTPWRVGVADPRNPRSLYVARFFATDTSVVTSGVYERGFELEGRWYHHIIDTGTGYPVDNELMSVTIIHPVSMVADALSTACFILGLEDAMALIESMPEAQAVFITRDDEIVPSSGLEGLLEIIQ